MTWSYKDPRWDDDIEPGTTYAQVRSEVSGLKRFANVEASTMSVGGLKSLRSYCRARAPHYNAPPIGLKPVSEEDAGRWFDPGSAGYIESKQIYPLNEETDKPNFNSRKKIAWPWELDSYEGFGKDSDKPEHRKGRMIPITCFYMWDGTGWGMSAKGGKVKWFRFGCEHKWGPPPDGHPAKQRRLFRCQHLYYCVECGHWQVIDSSD